jgi:small subunit ribosomal protein S12e
MRWHFEIKANNCVLQSDGEEPTSPIEEVAAADEVEVAGDSAAAAGGSMSVLDALKGTQKYLTTGHNHLYRPKC